MSAETPMPSGGQQLPPVHVHVQRGGSSGCLGVLVVLLLLALGFCVIIIMGLAASRGGDATAGLVGGPKKPARMGEKWVAGDDDADRVALIELSGVIMDEVDAGLFGAQKQSLVERIRREVAAAAKDDRVKAVVFAVNSPGGSANTSEEIWHVLKTFKETTKKPVVVWMNQVAASGGYYVAMAADEIIATETTITGSIGVITGGINISALAKSWGIEDVTITSGANKDLLNPMKPVDPEDRAIIQAMVDRFYNIFLDRVEYGRAPAGLDRQTIRKLADGRIYMAREALELKLIDGIGYRDDAFAAAKKRAGLTQATLFRYSRTPSFLELFEDVEARAGGQRLDLSLETVLSLGRMRVLYLWAPGVR